MNGAATAFMTVAMNGTPTEDQGFAVRQGIGHSPASLGEDSGKGGPGDTHPGRSLLLVEPLKVRKAKGLKAVERHRDLLDISHGHAQGLHNPLPQAMGHPSLSHRPWHSDTSVMII
jgi:hypothetical protein